MAHEREAFATRIDVTILAAVKVLAEKEGRAIESIVEEALGDLLIKHGDAKPDSSVMAAYQTSHERFGKLYRKLAE